MKRFFLLGLSATAACATLAAGCGSGGRTIAVPASTPTPVATPTPIGATPTPTPSPSPVASSRAGDFAFVGSATSTALPGAIPLDSAGAGSTTFVLQSVNGFTSPVTFVPSVTATSDTGGGATVNPGAVSVTFSPASLASLPTGMTPVTMSVKAPTTLPPLTRVYVALYAQGGGLKRYPDVGAYDNSGTYQFITPGLGFTDFNVPFDVPGTTTQNTFSGDVGSTLSAVADIETYGLSGTATFAITGLPTGLTATFSKPTLAIVPTPTLDSNGDPQSPQVVVTFTANQFLPQGTYPVHLTATLNGTTFTSGELDIAVPTGLFRN